MTKERLYYIKEIERVRGKELNYSTKYYLVKMYLKVIFPDKEQRDVMEWGIENTQATVDLLLDKINSHRESLLDSQEEGEEFSQEYIYYMTQDFFYGVWFRNPAGLYHDIARLKEDTPKKPSINLNYLTNTKPSFWLTLPVVIMLILYKLKKI